MILFAEDVAPNFFVSEQEAINIDAIHVVLLPFYPTAALTKFSLTPFNKIGVREIRLFKSLTKEGLGHLGFVPRCGGSLGPHHHQMKGWLKALPTSYQGNVGLMAHLLAIVSRLTGHHIRGLGVAPGAVPEPDTFHTLHAVQDIENLADSMSLEKRWGKGAPVLRALYQELKHLIFSYYTARDANSGTFGLSLE